MDPYERQMLMQLPPQYRPLSAWAYFGYSILFAIPVIGFIMTIVFACSNENINRRNYARSLLIGLAIAVVFGIAATVGIVALGGVSINHYYY